MKRATIGIIILTAIVGGFLFFIKPPAYPVVTHTPILSPTPQEARIAGRYTGTFPCGDCSGLEIELTLYPDSVNQTNGQYALKATYRGRDREPLLTNGAWKVIRGSATDIRTLVIQLTADKTQEIQYYELKNSSTLVYLDRDKKEIQSPAKLELTKK